ncbi:MAG: threonine ammonia-lyase [Thermogemmatispora sp.]|jgi:threonine dehydratase|uniref:threonine ammonia-lyase n=1 Tax=Thermogemmatispora aurantia TaxID=2045279 RepID=A0A5J4KDZ7_9CHLR|nr:MULTISPECIES: threonine ammonia-lyase [Thermogemmatispora]MBE3564196.1 threonine ammonia-lyase [Thermogemmatispora sp.]GER84671.1 threonine ammonia-lyase [Thermogemmatispora aurantia]
MRVVNDDHATGTGEPADRGGTPSATPAAVLSSSTALPVTIADIWEAYKLLKPLLHHTPLTPSRTLREMTGAEVYLKAENMQRSGSFKVRGASFKLSRLSEQDYQRGVIAASAGNHAQGVAIAAAQHKIPCTIVMPETAPLAKVMATQGYGAEVVLHGFTYDDAYQRCLELREQTGATFIHAFDDPDIIAGQGTLGLEMLSDLPDADAILVPIGGGGLIAGIAIAARALRPNITIIGVQAAGAPSCRSSLDAGKPLELPAITTVADGIAVKRPGELTFSVIQRLVDDVVLVDDEAIISAVLFLMERCKMLVEGAGAAGVAALLSGTVKLPGKKVLVPLTGGNIDINLVGRFIEHGLAAAGRYFVIHTRLEDRPGELMRFLGIIADMRINVIDVRHQRISSHLPIMQREETLTLETRDRAQCEQLLERLRAAGYVVEEAQSLD